MEWIRVGVGGELKRRFNVKVMRQFEKGCFFPENKNHSEISRATQRNTLGRGIFFFCSEKKRSGVIRRANSRRRGGRAILSGTPAPVCCALTVSRVTKEAFERERT